MISVCDGRMARDVGALCSHHNLWRRAGAYDEPSLCWLEVVGGSWSYQFFAKEVGWTFLKSEVKLVSHCFFYFHVERVFMCYDTTQGELARQHDLMRAKKYEENAPKVDRILIE